MEHLKQYICGEKNVKQYKLITKLLQREWKYIKNHSFYSRSFVSSKSKKSKLNSIVGIIPDEN